MYLYKRRGLYFLDLGTLADVLFKVRICSRRKYFFAHKKSNKTAEFNER